MAEASRWRIMLCLGCNDMGRDDRMGNLDRPNIVIPAGYHQPRGSIVLGDTYIRNARQVMRWIKREGYAPQVAAVQVGNEIEVGEDAGVMPLYRHTFKRLHTNVRRILGADPWVATGGTKMVHWGDDATQPYSPGRDIAQEVKDGWHPRGGRILWNFHDSYSYEVFSRELPAIAGWLRHYGIDGIITLGVTESFQQGQSLRFARFAAEQNLVCYAGFPSLGHGPDIDVPVERWGNTFPGFDLQALAAWGPKGLNRGVRREQRAVAKALGVWDGSQRIGGWPYLGSLSKAPDAAY